MNLKDATLGLVLAICIPALAVADPGGGDAGDDPLTAAPVEAGSHAGTLTAGDEDWYQVPAPMLVRVQVRLDGCEGAYTLQLLRGNGQPAIVEGGCGETLECLSAWNQLLYARVSGGVGDYVLTVAHAPALDGLASGSAPRSCAP